MYGKINFRTSSTFRQLIQTDTLQHVSGVKLCLCLYLLFMVYFCCDFGAIRKVFEINIYISTTVRCSVVTRRVFKSPSTESLHFLVYIYTILTYVTNLFCILLGAKVVKITLKSNQQPNCIIHDCKLECIIVTLLVWIIVIKLLVYYIIVSLLVYIILVNLLVCIIVIKLLVYIIIVILLVYILVNLLLYITLNLLVCIIIFNLLVCIVNSYFVGVHSS